MLSVNLSYRDIMKPINIIPRSAVARRRSSSSELTSAGAPGCRYGLLLGEWVLCCCCITVASGLDNKLCAVVLQSIMWMDQIKVSNGIIQSGCFQFSHYCSSYCSLLFPLLQLEMVAYIWIHGIIQSGCVIFYKGECAYIVNVCVILCNRKKMYVTLLDWAIFKAIDTS